MSPLWEVPGRSHAGGLFQSLLDAEKLGEPDKTIYCYVLRHGRSTRRRLSQVASTSLPLIDEAIDRLKKMGLVLATPTAAGEFVGSVATTSQSPARRAYPAGAIIPAPYQFNLLCDNERVRAFKASIEHYVRPGMRVLDLGSGSGVLSIFAARCGAEVLAVESDPEVAEIAEFLVKDQGVEDHVQVICADAVSLELEWKADAIICEMLDTALIAELQVPVMNHAISHLLKEGGIVIPRATTTSIQALEVDFQVQGYEFRLLHFDDSTTNRVRREASRPVLLHSIDFATANPLRVERQVDIQIDDGGIVNALGIRTEVDLGVERLSRGTPWLNPPLIIPIPEIRLGRQEHLRVMIQYELGTSLRSIDCRAWKREP